MRARALIAMLALIALLAAACGSDDPAAEPDETDDEATDEPTETEDEPTETDDEATDEPTDEPTEPAQLETVSVRTSWSMIPNWTPFLLGIERGYYAEEGIDLQLEMGQGSGTVIPLVGNGEDDFAFIDLATMIRFVSQDMPVKSVGVILRQADYGVACYASAEVDEPKDLEGKSLIVVPGESLAQIWPAFVEATGIDESAVTIRTTDTASKFALMLEGAADCELGLNSQDLVLIRLENPEIEEPLRWADYGVALIGNGLIAHDDTIAERPEIVQGMVNATVRAFKETCDDPEAAAEFYIEQTDEGDDEWARAMLPEYCKLANPPEGDPGEPYSTTGDDLWQASVELLTDYADLEGAKEASAYYTDEFMENLPE